MSISFITVYFLLRVDKFISGKTVVTAKLEIREMATVCKYPVNLCLLESRFEFIYYKNI